MTTFPVVNGFKLLIFCSLQIGEEGLACGEEIEAALELTAPERPGRYVSHWRLLAPNGPKFGHRVWALIQVRLWKVASVSWHG